MRRGLPALVALAAFVCVVVGPASLAGGAPPAAAAPIPQRPAPSVLDDLRGLRAREAAGALPLALDALGAMPTARETAAFAAGRVAVAVVFVESDGSVDPSTENWSRPDPDNPGDRRANVLAKVQAALIWWNERSPDGSLEVFLPAAGQYGAPRAATTRYAPISRPVSQFNKDYRRAGRLRQASAGRPLNGLDVVGRHPAFVPATRVAAQPAAGLLEHAQEFTRPA